jgi:hypothetical protein
MSQLKRVEIYIPSDVGCRCVVRTETLGGSAVPGVPFRIIDPGESAAFELDPLSQQLVVAVKPEE